MGDARDDMTGDVAFGGSPTGAEISLGELGEIVLTPDARQLFADLVAPIGDDGFAAWQARFGDYVDDFDEVPHPSVLFVQAGSHSPSATIGWCEWSGEDTAGAVEGAITAACQRLGLSVPEWTPGGASTAGELLIAADLDLQNVGLRLLMLTLDSDVYYFVPVTAAHFAVVDGRHHGELTLNGVEVLAPDRSSEPVTVPATSASPPTSASPRRSLSPESDRASGGPPPIVSAPAPKASAWTAAFGPIRAVEVTEGDAVVGYLYAGQQVEADRGGFVLMELSAASRKSTTLVEDTIADFRARGVPPAQALESCLGRELGNGVRIAEAARDYATVEELRRLTRTELSHATGVGARMRVQEMLDDAGYGRIARRRLDAALRGEIAMTRTIVDQIFEVDREIAERPLATEREVAFVVDAHVFGDGIAEGSWWINPAYLRLHEPDAVLPTGVRVLLSVPAGFGMWDVSAPNVLGPDPLEPDPTYVVGRGSRVAITEVVSRGIAPVVRARLSKSSRTRLVIDAYGGLLRTLRDRRASQGYFDARVLSAESTIAHSNYRLTDWPDDRWRDARARAIAARDNAHQHMGLFKASYSQGAPLSVLREIYERMLISTERATALMSEAYPDRRKMIVHNHEGYWQVLSMLSLALTFEVDDATFDRVVAAVYWHHGDCLVDRLIAVRRPDHPIGTELLFPRLVKRLHDAFEAKEPTKTIATYLGKWYGIWKSISGWETHSYLNTSHYAGYWAFEILGVVVALGLDDVALRGSEFYPGDLLPTKAVVGESPKQSTRRAPWSGLISAHVPRAIEQAAERLLATGEFDTLEEDWSFDAWSADRRRFEIALTERVTVASDDVAARSAIGERAKFLAAVWFPIGPRREVVDAYIDAVKAMKQRWSIRFDRNVRRRLGGQLLDDGLEGARFAGADGVPNFQLARADSATVVIWRPGAVDSVVSMVTSRHELVASDPEAFEQLSLSGGLLDDVVSLANAWWPFEVGCTQERYNHEQFAGHIGLTPLPERFGAH